MPGLPETSQLVVSTPSGAHFAVVELSTARMTAGRLPGCNDIALQPDPELLVTRIEHLAFEREESRWYVVDNGSVNGTYLRRNGNVVRVEGRAKLESGDVVCVVGELQGPGRPRYWEFAFGDSAKTRAVALPRLLRLTYHIDEARLVVDQGGETHEITLRRQSHKLVRYIAERNGEAGDELALCSHDELMSAVWGDEPLHSREDLARLFWELRRKLEPFGGADLVETARGLGYRVRVRPS